jgi:hypothetical protein
MKFRGEQGVFRNLGTRVNGRGTFRSEDGREAEEGRKGKFDTASMYSTGLQCLAFCRAQSAHHEPTEASLPKFYVNGNRKVVLLERLPLHPATAIRLLKLRHFARIPGCPRDNDAKIKAIFIGFHCGTAPPPWPSSPR